MCYRSMTDKNRKREHALKKFDSNLTKSAESNNKKLMFVFCMSFFLMIRFYCILQKYGSTKY